jgi:hypothetical protein
MSSRYYAVNLPDEGVTEQSFEELHGMIAGLNKINRYCIISPRDFENFYSWVDSSEYVFKPSVSLGARKVGFMGEFLGIEIIVNSHSPVGIMFGDAVSISNCVIN